MLKQDSIQKRSSTVPAGIAVLLGLMLVLTVSGCGTTKGPASASFASVTIQNHTEAEIIAATTQVFIADGYKGGPSGLGKMTFEKEASRGTTLAREGLVGTAYGAQSYLRVRVETMELSREPIPAAMQGLHGEWRRRSVFQSEVGDANFRSGPWQLNPTRLRSSFRNLSRIRELPHPSL